MTRLGIVPGGTNPTASVTPTSRAGESPANVGASPTPSPGSLPDERTCDVWAYRDACRGAIGPIREFVALTTWDRRAFAGDPGRLTSLEEQTLAAASKLMTPALATEFASLRERAVREYQREPSLRIVRAELRAVAVAPIDEGAWTETIARLRFRAEVELEVLGGDVVCSLDEYRVTARREAVGRPWLLDRGLFVPESAVPCEDGNADAEAACASWPYREACEEAVDFLLEYFAFASWDRRGFAHDPGRLTELEEETWEDTRRFFTPELYAELAPARATAARLIERGSPLRIVRISVRAESVQPINSGNWSEIFVYLGARTSAEIDFINGDTSCILEEYRMGLRRESPKGSWLFDRGVVTPVDSKTTSGPCGE